MGVGEVGRARRNMEALRTLQALEDGTVPRTAENLAVVAGWTGWGAVPRFFDDADPRWAAERDELRNMVGEDGYRAARRTTINAHYTDAAFVDAMWQTVVDLGLHEGRVLEPGSGSGNFLGVAPQGVAVTGVELDPTTARISRMLYPDAEVRTESFADTRLPRGFFDGAIGNVPFGDVTLHDPTFNAGGHSLHDHFILKSLALTRPGGVAVVLSSRYTLDATSPAARREMNALADLLGAVRLPTGAHRRTAGTEVVTDVLVFRRREPGREPLSTAWETVGPHQVGEETIRRNHYFELFPEHVLGEEYVGHGMYGENTYGLTATPGAEVAGQVRASLDGIVATAHTLGLGATERRAEELAAAPVRVAAAGSDLWDGHLEHDPATGEFTRLANGVFEPFPVPKTHQAEFAALLGLRDQARALLTLEAGTLEDTAELAAAREALRGSWEGYVERWGPVNRFTERRTGRTHPETGEELLARVSPPAPRLLKQDPFGPLVKALENFDEATQQATPAALLLTRTVNPPHEVLGAETAEDALAITLETRGRVDLDHIAHLLGVDPGEARTQLGDSVYDVPGGGLVTRAEYLSGNVRIKLEQAQAAVEEDPRFATNVTALRGVIPPDLGPEDIDARIGAAWIPAEDHEQFLRDLLEDSYVVVENGAGAIWAVKGGDWGIRATEQWGTDRMPAGRIFQAVLEQRTIQVMFPPDDDGRRVVDPTATAAAQEKAALLQERFGEWVWEDPDRAARLAREYNHRFNALVLRDYDPEGTRLRLPGLALSFTPRDHQRAAVARMINEPAVGLFHEVGAGKSAEMVIGAMELRRLGMVAKPAVVVPNHMLEQFTREWLQLYPQARILAASSADLRGDARRTFVARAATNDWDAVILTRGAFERIGVRRDTAAEYLDREVSSLRAALERMKEQGAGLTVKRLERIVVGQEEAIKKALDGPQEPGVSFEDTGIDYLVVDEMHDFKNLRTVSNIQDANITGSKRATDLHMKIGYLRQTHGERVITGATATPIANSVTEAHVMQRYLRPDLLEQAGVLEFDRWAATFGQLVTEVEMAPTGGGAYRQKTRFAKFGNVPEMLRTWHTFADVKTADDLHLPVPELAVRADGKRLPETVVITPTNALVDYVAELGERAERVHTRQVEPAEDNMLKISTDGRKAALDVRLVNRDALLEDDVPAKVEVAADRIAGIWQAHREDVFVDVATGAESAQRGALQLVFCDLGTPGDGWNVYQELRDQLVARGLPRDGVKFIHDAKTDVEKERLFAAARSGHVDVLVGSTQKMGVGTNVQARAVALHHLDCPWRPADIAQREGRIIRQGNQNPEVGILRYVVEGSFDAYSWQTEVPHRRAEVREPAEERLPPLGRVPDHGGVQAHASHDAEALHGIRSRDARHVDRTIAAVQRDPERGPQVGHRHTEGPGQQVPRAGREQAQGYSGTGHRPGDLAHRAVPAVHEDEGRTLSKSPRGGAPPVVGGRGLEPQRLPSGRGHCRGQRAAQRAGAAVRLRGIDHERRHSSRDGHQRRASFAGSSSARARGVSIAGSSASRSRSVATGSEKYGT